MSLKYEPSSEPLHRSCLTGPFLPDLLTDSCSPLSPHPAPRAALEATHGQMDGFFSQLPYKCYLFEVAFVGD